MNSSPPRRVNRPLDGIRVLDLSRLLPGPYATHILASFGAEVIKVERPGEGDYLREYEPKAEGLNAVFLTINRGKKSIAIDLKHPDGKEAFIALAQTSDVVLDGFRPGVMEQLGLGYEQLKEAHPGLVYAALTGYGQTGPHANRAGHDLNYVALAGMLDLLGGGGRDAGCSRRANRGRGSRRATDCDRHSAGIAAPDEQRHRPVRRRLDVRFDSRADACPGGELHGDQAPPEKGS